MESPWKTVVVQELLAVVKEKVGQGMAAAARAVLAVETAAAAVLEGHRLAVRELAKGVVAAEVVERKSYSSCCQYVPSWRRERCSSWCSVAGPERTCWGTKSSPQQRTPTA